MTCFTCNRNHPSLKHGMALLTGTGVMHVTTSEHAKRRSYISVRRRNNLFSFYRKSQGVKNFTLVGHAISSPINLTSRGFTQGDLYKVRLGSSEVRLNKTLEISENSENLEKKKVHKSSVLRFLTFLMFSLT